MSQSLVIKKIFGDTISLIVHIPYSFVSLFTFEVADTSLNLYELPSCGGTLFIVLLYLGFSLS